MRRRKTILPQRRIFMERGGRFVSLLAKSEEQVLENLCFFDMTRVIDPGV